MAPDEDLTRTREVISTFATVPHLLDDNDIRYVAKTGRILPSSTVSVALGNRTTADNRIEIASDGSVISQSQRAIDLSMPLATNTASNTVVIGQSGLVRSVTNDAIFLFGPGNSVANSDEVAAGAVRIGLTGDFGDRVQDWLLALAGKPAQVAGDLIF